MDEFKNVFEKNYKLKEINYDFDPGKNIMIENIDQLVSKISDKIKTESSVVAYLDYKVLFGKFENNSILFYENEKPEIKFLQKIRVFNENEELYFWKNGNSFNSRYVKDKEGNGQYVLDSNNYLYGTITDKLDGYFSKLTEDRGTEIIFPISDLKESNNGVINRILKATTRNYIGYTKMNQATYIDSRLVKIERCENGK
jgi:CRISPR-associated protein (TIGR03984 family)